MAANTKIEWADHTFNPWVGCAKVGPGCDHCYAESWAKRTGAADLWDGKRRRTKTWGNPLKWNRDAKAKGVRYRVFCASLADVFDNAVPVAWRADLWNLIAATSHLDWIIVTKRIGNVFGMLPLAWGAGWPHVWLLATVCNQAEADRDVPKLLETPAAVRGISYEPALGPVDLRRWMRCPRGGPDSCGNADGTCAQCDFHRTSNNALDWVICGGESGPQARPMHPDWARSVRDQCQAAGVAFFFKQWGGWYPAVFETGDGDICAPAADHDTTTDPFGDDTYMWRLPYKSAMGEYGRLLDGRTWDEYPGQGSDVR